MEIAGVKIKKLTVHLDVPDIVQKVPAGVLVEILRDDDRFLTRFGQSTMSVAYKNTIKAFHWHKKQDDIWFIASGKARIVLYDRRQKSLTKGATQIIEAPENSYQTVLIPRGVVHGYKVLSSTPVRLIYHTSKSYDHKNPDEERLPWDFLGKEVWQ